MKDKTEITRKRTAGENSGSGISRRNFLQSSLIGGSAILLSPRFSLSQSAPQYAEGVVFHDRSGNGIRQPGDPGLAGVLVSNGRDVVKTDQQGRWRLPVEGETTVFFVIKPRGWRTPAGSDLIPRFHYIHYPDGSPRLQYRGVEPTGSLPLSIDFPLYPQQEADRFRVVICGDPQPRDHREIDYIARTVVPDLAGVDAAFGVSLGDIMFDDLDLFEPLNEVMGLIGIPWHNVLGNHDLNFDARDNQHATDTFMRVYGPSWYAFEYGPVQFFVLNNVEWMGTDPERPDWTGNYRGNLPSRQIDFVRNVLEHVPKDRLIVLLMHIPLNRGFDPSPTQETANRQALYRLLEDRPNTVSIAAHTHWHRHLFLGRDDGWLREEPHHHIIMGTICGSWFRGAPDPQGVPHATMSDGTPRGYAMVTFDQNRYSMDGYRVFGKPSEYQMNIDVPTRIDRNQLQETSVYANIFNGSDHCMARMRPGPNYPWRPMEKVYREDPSFVRLVERDAGLEAPFRSLPGAANCSHLWQSRLPAGLGTGTHLIEVEAIDMFGNKHHGRQTVTVTG